ncbi:alpha/beta hydrolase [Prolixibacteraceae bacterium JC049]|nr:alpha/beta hydrolase [Prolixibacteraceae bacterium JC049]
MKNLRITLALIILIVSNVTAQQLNIKVEVRGEGTPVLLLPGFTCPGEVWKETVDEIAEKNECHMISYPGFGDVAPIDTLWLETVKQDVIKYLDDNKLKKVKVIGHSMGGTLALWLAAERNKHIEEVMVVDALPCMGAVMFPNYSSDQIQYNTPYNQNLLNMNEAGFKAMATNFAQFMCLDKSKHKQLVDWMNIADRKTYVYGYTDLLKVDLREAVGNIAVNVKVLAATHPNKQMIEQNYQKQYVALKQKEIIYIDNSAHFIMFDQFNTYIQQVKQFLKQ